MSLDVNKALKEVDAKTDADIDVETAWTWASRSAACYRRWAETNSFVWLIRADRFRHEAVEHAAGAHDGGKTVASIEEALQKFAEGLV